MICMFATPLEEDHNKPQAVVLEGKYWKRRLGAIVEEYKKWRKFFRPVRDPLLTEDDMMSSVMSSLSTASWKDNQRGHFGEMSRFSLLLFLTFHLLCVEYF
jgi:hypothetical protein